MSKEKILFVLGILVIALPHLGFSNGVEKIILAVFGVVMIIIAYALFFRSRTNIVETPTKKPRQPSTRKPRTAAPIAETKAMPEPPKEAPAPAAEETNGFTFVKRNDRA